MSFNGLVFEQKIANRSTLIALRASPDEILLEQLTKPVVSRTLKFLIIKVDFVEHFDYTFLSNRKY